MVAVETPNFVDRVVELPTIAAAVHQALSTYQRTKSWNPLLGYALGVAESGVKFAAEKAKPVYGVLNKPIQTADKVACHQLETLEQKYPAIKKTPEELWEELRRYYEASYVRSGINAASAVKQYGVTKVHNTSRYCRELALGRVSGLVRLGMSTLSGALDLSDAIIYKYIAVPEDSKKEGDEDEDDEDADADAETSAVSRVQHMSEVVMRGLTIRAAAGCARAKRQLLATLNQLQMTVAAVQYTRSTAGWANEKTREAAAQFWLEFRRRAEQIGAKPEPMLLQALQMLSVGLAKTVSQMAGLTSPYLSETAQKSLAAAAQYAHDLEDQLAKAKTVSEVRDELVHEAKERLQAVEESILSAVNYLTEFPPLNWLVSSRYQNRRGESDKTGSNGKPS